MSPYILLALVFLLLPLASAAWITIPANPVSVQNCSGTSYSFSEPTAPGWKVIPQFYIADVTFNCTSPGTNVTVNITTINNFTTTTTANVTALMTINDSTRYDGTRSGGQSGFTFNEDDGADVVSTNMPLFNVSYSVESWISIADVTRSSLFGDTTATRGYMIIGLGATTIAFEPTSAESLGCTISGISFSQNTLYHIFINVNATNITLFTNGAFTKGCTPINGIVDLNISRFGGGYTGVASSYLNGSGYQFSVWNRTLSSAEISDEYVLGPNAITNNTNSLILQYLLNRSEDIYSNSTNVKDVAWLSSGEYYHKLYDSSGAQLRTVVWS